MTITPETTPKGSRHGVVESACRHLAGGDGRLVTITTQTADTLWTAGEAAAYLCCSRSHLWRLRQAGTLPDRDVGGLLRFEPDEVKACAQRRGSHARSDVAPTGSARRPNRSSSTRGSFLPTTAPVRRWADRKADLATSSENSNSHRTAGSQRDG